MEIATSIRRKPPEGVARPAATARGRRPTLPVVALGLLAVAAAVLFVVYPVQPNYDSYYSLVWGRELLQGTTPSFEAFRAPTEHPLAIAFGALLALFGDDADRAWQAATLASFVVLAAGLYRLGRIALTPAIGLIAALLLVSRFDFPFLAIRGYIDVPYMAFVIWAAVLEAQRPRRGTPVQLLLAAAGLMRPEAWVLGGLYWLWIAYPMGWGGRIRSGVLMLIAPVIWVATDFAVTGEPLFSLTHTTTLAESLERNRTPREIPGASWRFMKALDKPPVFFAGLLGLGLAGWFAPRRLGVPVALLVAGIGTFLLLGFAGLSVIDRYLLVPALVMMVMASVVLGGWSMLEPGRLRTAWIAGAVLIALAGAGITATRLNLNTFRNQLSSRADASAALKAVLAEPAVQAARSCGPMSVPNHKLLPDVRWALDAKEDQVIARADPDQAQRIRSGTALYITDRSTLLRQALADPTDDVRDQLPLPGFRRIATGDYYAVYSSC